MFLALEVREMKRQRKVLLSRISVFFIMILIVGISFSQLSFMSVTQDTYAPGVISPHEGDLPLCVLVCGYVYRMNKTTELGEPVVDLKVRIYATDEQFDDIVYTDELGRYESTKKFQVGQLVTLLIEGTRYIRFISYYAENTFKLDVVQIWE